MWCGLRNTRCSVSKVGIISLVFKWLIVLRSAMKTGDQRQRVLKLPLLLPKMHEKCTFFLRDG